MEGDSDHWEGEGNAGAFNQKKLMNMDATLADAYLMGKAFARGT
jgi:hypothetical protein